ncbi:hypothetical protein HN51_021867 [Arachis hypogaea]
MNPRSILIFILVSSTLFSTIYGQIKFCHQTLTVNGRCDATRGALDCALEFLSKFGARAMPMHCTCQNRGNSQRLCACDINASAVGSSSK